MLGDSIAGVLVVTVLAVDVWVLSGLPVPSVLAREQWFVAPAWIIISFACCCLGFVPFLSALEGWLGPVHVDTHEQVPPLVVAALCAVFAVLCASHISSLLFAPSKKRRRLCFLGVAITGCAFMAYSSMLSCSATVPSTYGGRPFEPLRYVLWAHTTPAMALIVAAASSPPWYPGDPSGEGAAGAAIPLLPLVRMIGAGCMGSGFMATARVPALPASLRAYPAVDALYTYAWRTLWLAASFLAMFVALYRLCRLVQLDRSAPAFRRNLICTVVVATWSCFPVVWLLAELGLVDGAGEGALYAMCDLCAKSFCSFLLLRGSDSQLEWFDRQMEREQLQVSYERELSTAHEQLVKAEQELGQRVMLSTDEDTSLMQALRTCRDFSSHVVVRHLGRGSVSRVALLRREKQEAKRTAEPTEAKQEEAKQEAQEKAAAAAASSDAPSAAAGDPNPEETEPAGTLIKGGRPEDMPDYVVAKSVSVAGGYEDKHLQQIETEIRALKQLRHQHIIGYVGVFVQPTMVTILTEYATGGTVRAQIDSARSVGRLPGARVELWMTQLAAGLEFIHRHMMHRDLKPCNLLLGAHDTLKICDFGWSTPIAAMARTFAGSPLYMAPEVLRHEPYSHTADLWSVGVILYELITLKRPFLARDLSELTEVVESHQIELASDEALRLSGHRHRMCRLATSEALLHASSSERMTIAQLIQELEGLQGLEGSPGGSPARDGSPDRQDGAPLSASEDPSSPPSATSGSPGKLAESRVPPVPRPWLAPAGAWPRQRRPSQAQQGAQQQGSS